jgi:hypothetical protein
VLGATLAYQIVLLLTLRPVSSVLGWETKDAFLVRTVGGYAALRHLETLQGVGRIYMAWDGQGYYCDDGCIVDAEQSQWAQLVDSSRSNAAITASLRRSGVTHMLVNLDGMNFLLQHDPSGIHNFAADTLVEEYGPACLRPVFVSDSAVAYKLVCE